MLPAADSAIATEARFNTLLESVVERVVAGRGARRSDRPSRLGEAVDVMVLILARDAATRARRRVLFTEQEREGA